MTKKEELVQQLGAMRKINDGGYSHNLSYTMKRWEIELVADWIMQDRNRIVYPLINLSLVSGGSSYEKLCQGIEETIKLAGIELERN